MKSIKEIREAHPDCKIVVSSNTIEVLYSNGSNQMALPHTIALYNFHDFLWQRGYE